MSEKVKTKTRKVECEQIYQQGSVTPKSFNEKNNTVEMVFSTGVRVKRFSWFDADFFQELEMTEKAVNLSRLNAGAPFLNSHSSWGVDSVLGVIQNAEIRNKKGIATVRLSDEPEDASIVNKIKSGIIRNVSVGFTIEKLVEQEPDKKTGLKVFRAMNWTPLEISAVAIPADAKAQFRSQNSHKSICEIEEIIRGHENMENLNGKTEKELEAEKRNLENSKIPVQSDNKENKKDEEKRNMENEKQISEAKKEGQAAEKTRQADIRDAVRAAGLEKDFSDKLINDSVEVDAARKLIIEKLADKSDSNKTVNTNATIVRDEKDTMTRGMTAAILHRFQPHAYKLSDEGQNFRNMSLIEHARAMLETEGVNTRNMPKMEIAKRALNSTSDFPILLENIAIKVLRRAYDEAPATWMPFVTEGTLPDFKLASRAQLGDAPELKLLGENAEYQEGTISEAGEKIQLRTFGRRINLSRKMLINDDLSAFTRIPEKFGRRARQLESDLIWATLLDNADLSDGEALFSAAHKNIGTGAALDATALGPLGEARKLMRKQVGLDGERISVAPKWLLVPPELETEANKIATLTTPNKAGDINDFGPQGNTSLRVVVENRLSDSTFNAGFSLTRWFVMSTVADVDMIEIARLEGESGPVVETNQNPDIDGIMIKARHDVGVKVLEFRGMVRNAGV